MVSAAVQKPITTTKPSYSLKELYTQQSVPIETFFTNFLKAHPLTFVRFTRKECSACKSSEPVWRAAAREYYKQAFFLEVIYDEFFTLGKKYNVRSVPFILFFRDNVVVWSGSGHHSTIALFKELLRKHVT